MIYGATTLAQNKHVHVHTLCYETYTLVQFYVKIKMSCSVLVEYTILLHLIHKNKLCTIGSFIIVNVPVLEWESGCC